MRTSQASAMVALLLVGTLAFATAQNVSEVLANYPQFSTFTKLIQDTGVINEVQTRSSLTILLPDNGVLDAYVAAHPGYTTQEVADVLRYHVLLQYFGGDELAALSPVGLIATSLYQTTGRANDLDGFVNLTRSAAGTVTVGPSTPAAAPQANIVTNVTQYPYNYSFIQISAPLEPLGLAAAQLAPTSPPIGAPAPVPSVEEPVEPPVEEPIESPITEEPISAPIEEPAEPPVEPPMATPVTPGADAPEADGPGASGPSAVPPSSSASAVRFSAAAVVSAFVVAALGL